MDRTVQAVTRRRRGVGRSIAGLAAAVAVVASALVAGSSASYAAPPTEDCAVPYPVAELTDGQPVRGLTVSKGTTPEEFTGEILGVLEDGIAPDVDMTSPPSGEKYPKPRRKRFDSAPLRGSTSSAMLKTSSR